jgi:hypothetical protein
MKPPPPPAHLTEKGCQSLSPALKPAPSALKRSSSRKGTLPSLPTPRSSLLEKPVTCTEVGTTGCYALSYST